MKTDSKLPGVPIVLLGGPYDGEELDWPLPLPDMIQKPEHTCWARGLDGKNIKESMITRRAARYFRTGAMTRRYRWVP